MQVAAAYSHLLDQETGWEFIPIPPTGPRARVGVHSDLSVSDNWLVTLGYDLYHSVYLSDCNIMATSFWDFSLHVPQPLGTEDSALIYSSDNASMLVAHGCAHATSLASYIIHLCCNWWQSRWIHQAQLNWEHAVSCIITFVMHAKLTTVQNSKIQSFDVSSMCNNIMFAFSLQFPLLSSLHGRTYGIDIF